MTRSNEEIVKLINRKVNMLILELMPEPTCPQKRLKHRWEVEKVRKELAGRIWAEGNGVTVEIKV